MTATLSRPLNRRRGARTGVAAAAMAAFVGLGGWTAQPAGAPLLISGAEIFDATGAAPYRGDVLIRDGRIAEIGPRLRAPRGARVVDARGQALLPGFFDVHTHWTPGGSPAITPDIATAYVEAGVTTVNDFHQPPEAFEPRRRWLSTLATPHVNLTARMSTPGGHGADWADQNTTRWVNTPDAARAGVEAIAAYQPDLIKAFADGWRYGQSADNTSMDEATLAALVAAAHARDIKVVTHTVTVARGGQAARAGVDIIVHSLQDREVDAETIADMKANKTVYAPTLAVYEPVKPGQTPPTDMDTPRMRQSLRKFQFALDNVRRLQEAGVLIALGTDAGMPGTPHGAATLREMELLVQAGLTPTQALMAGTANSAEAMGVLADRGTIAVGKRADLVLVEGQPWRDITHVRRTQGVIIDGRPVFGSAFGSGVTLPAANLQPLMPALTTAALVDDFERADQRTALDTLRVDDFDGGQDRSVQLSQVVPDETGNHVLHLAAKMSTKTSPYAGVVLPLSRGGVEPVDVTAWRGVRFDVRGDGQAYELRLRGHQGQWRKTVAAGSEWQTVEVAFSTLEPVVQRNGGAGADWSGDNLFDLRIGGARDAGETLWLELDNVTFY